MRHQATSLCALLVTLATTVSLRAEEKVKDTDYYPLKVGTTWHYVVGDKTITITVAKHEKVGGVLCALVETKVGGKVMATEHISVGKDGLYRHTVAGLKADTPVLFLKLPPKKGDTWKVASKIAGQNFKVTYKIDEEEIKVPAGKYQTIVTRTENFKVGDQDLSGAVWYAKGVGMVKTQMTIAGREVLLELKKFEPAK